MKKDFRIPSILLFACLGVLVIQSCTKQVIPKVLTVSLSYDDTQGTEVTAVSQMANTRKMRKLESIALGWAGTPSLHAALGTVPGCIENEFKLQLSEMTASVTVDAQTCPASTINLTAVLLKFPNLIGAIRINQGQQVQISPTVGIYSLSGSTVSWLGASGTVTGTITRTTNTTNGQIILNGVSQCTSANLSVVNNTSFTLGIVGTFPDTATGNNSDSNVTFNGASGGNSSWTVTVPGTSTGYLTYNTELTWSDSKATYSCKITANVAVNGTVVQAPNTAPPPPPEGFLCKGLPGFGDSPEYYMSLPRLSAITSIPELCPLGSCLLIATTGEPNPIITVASCWDTTNLVAVTVQ